MLNAARFITDEQYLSGTDVNKAVCNAKKKEMHNRPTYGSTDTMENCVHATEKKLDI